MERGLKESPMQLLLLLLLLLLLVL